MVDGLDFRILLTNDLLEIDRLLEDIPSSFPILPLLLHLILVDADCFVDSEHLLKDLLRYLPVVKYRQVGKLGGL